MRAEEGSVEERGRPGETVPPSGRVLGGHGGYGFGGIPVGHSPQHPLPHVRVAGADDLGGDAGAPDGENLGGRLGVQPAHQCGESSRVEVVYRRSWGCELHGMTALRGQVQVGPRKGVLPGARRQSA